MLFKSAIQKAFQRYFNFSARAGRAEFWYFFVFIIIAGTVITFIDQQLFPQADASSSGPVLSIGFDSSNGPLSKIFALLIVIPWFSVTARRLHDINRTGWWILFGFIPVIGWITMLVFLAKEGDAKDNRFGPAPPVEAPAQA